MPSPAMILRRIAPAAALCAMVLLSGCAGLASDQAPPPGPMPAPAKGMAAKSAMPPRAIRPPTRTPSDLNGLRPDPRPPADPPPPEPSPLVGLSEEQTLHLLGRPAEENPQPPGKIWIYDATGCRLSVHLFPDMDKGGYYALDYTAEGPGGSGRDDCLGRVADEARKRGGALAEKAG